MAQPPPLSTPPRLFALAGTLFVTIESRIILCRIIRYRITY
ncbi:MAG: hypothetical protein ACO3L4_10020 [Candidatus Puniceispirillaceae bacterium]